MQLHWAENLAEKVKKRYEPPYRVSGGMTTSGPTHFGTVCEFLFPGTVKKILTKQGHETTFYFIADILDAFDSVPASMSEYEKELSPHLGKPLCYVPDPTEKSKSFGDHYLDEAKGIMKMMNLDVNVVRVNEYYEQGKFDHYAKLFLDKREEAKKIVEETSGRELEKNWYPIMPICEKCGKIATTRVISYENEEYEYICDRDVKYTKGCGYKGKAKISDHKYKIIWRLHWPAWHHLLNTNLEGAGIDHHTKGGSYDTVRGIYKGIFGEEHPIEYRFGFILFKGKKYSKSKGTGMGVSELVKLIPPQMITYALLKPDLTENIDIVPTKENLWKLYDEFERIGKISEENNTEEGLEKLDRPIQKKVQAYKLCSGKVEWKNTFSDVIMTYAIYKDWEKVKEVLGDPEGAEYLKPYIEQWAEKDFIPEQYKFEYLGKKTQDKEIKEFLEGLDENADAVEIHNSVFEYSKKKEIPPKEVFKKMYLALIEKDRGPRLGNLIYALGVKRVKNDLL